MCGKTVPAFASSCLALSGAGAAASATMPRLIGIFRGINSIAFNSAKHSAEPQRDTESLFHYRALVYSVPLKTT